MKRVCYLIHAVTIDSWLLRPGNCNRILTLLQIEISEAIVNGMIKLATFDLGPLDIYVSSKNAAVTISLYFRTTYEARDSYKAYPISGFPRVLMLEEDQKRVLPLKK
jgi:hypothetical protein